MSSFPNRLSVPHVSGPRPGDTIGLIAGWGRFPILVAQKLKAQGYKVCCAGVRGHADPQLAETVDSFQLFSATTLGKVSRFFKRHHVQHATMAGKYHKVRLYHQFAWIHHLPDWKTLKMIYPFVTGKKDRKDDTILTAIVNTFAADDILFAPATDYAPELLVKTGTITTKKPTREQQRDIQFGWDIAKAMGGLDVGQSICVKRQAVIAVEAIEGTDLCIQRAGELCRQGEFSVIKVAKPNQDMRFDVPTIGVQTLQTMLKAGASLLAIEANQTILLDEQKFCDFANKHHLTVVALMDKNISQAVA